MLAEPPKRERGLSGRESLVPSLSLVAVSGLVNKTTHHKISPADQLLVDGHIRGHAIRTLIDNGSQISVIHPRICERLRIHTEKLASPQPTRMASGQTYKAAEEYCNITIEYVEATVNVSCLVLAIAEDVIIGNDWLKHNAGVINCKSDIVEFGPRGKRQIICGNNAPKLLDKAKPLSIHGLELAQKNDEIDEWGWIRLNWPDDGVKIAAISSSQERQLDKLRAKYAGVLDEPPTGPPAKGGPEMEIHLKEGTAPIAKPPYRLAHAETVELERQLAELLKKGYIRPSSSPWGAPVLFVKKKDGSLRLCVDYRGLNQKTIRDAFPMPRIEELLDDTRGATIFSKIDLVQAYHQVRIREEDIPKTAFRTKSGSFEYTVVPFGLTNAPAVFQRVMNHALSDLLGKTCIVYLDDILVFSRNVADHARDLDAVLERLKKHNLRSKPEKCAFFQKSIDFLGHRLSKDGIATDPMKVSAVREWKTPESTTDVRAFLGLSGYYRRFVKDYAKIAAPMTDLLAQSSFAWNEQADTAFRKLKKQLSSAPIVRQFDPKLPIRVETDASGTAIGGVLHQKHGTNWQPVAFYSAKMTPTQQNYPVHEQELLAIVAALGIWRHYLAGAEFELITDHESIKYIRTQRDLSKRQLRWLGVIEQFPFNPVYRKGCKNVVADGLSRSLTMQADRVLAERRDNAAQAEQSTPRTMAEPNTPTSTPSRTDGPMTPEPTTPEPPAVEPTAEPAVQQNSPITPAPSAAPAAHDMDDLTEALSRWSLSTLTVPQSESNSLKVQLLHDKAVLPVKAHDDDAGFDVSCVEEIDIAPKMQVTVPLGIAAKAPKGTFLQLAPRSGLAKKGVALLGGIVDAGYRGEIKVMLLNTGSAMVSLACGDRVAQLIPVKIELPSATQVDQLDETERGPAGFGSSGMGRIAAVRMAAVKSLDKTVSTNPDDSFKGDSKLDRIAKQLASGEAPESLAAKKTLAKYYMQDGTLFKKGRKCVGNRQDRELLLREFHDSALHPGEGETYRALSELFFWPGIYQDCLEYVRGCDQCQRTKSINKTSERPLQPLPIPKRNWADVSMDFITHLPKTKDGYNAILVVVDRLSKMAHFTATRDDANARETAQLYFDQVYRLHGLPTSIVSDRDAKFTSSFWKELWKLTGTKLNMSTAGHAQTDGQTERVNQVLKSMLRATCNHHQTDWKSLLTQAEFTYNDRANSSTKHSPFYANCGFNPRTAADLVFDVERDGSSPSATLDKLRRVNAEVRDNIEFAQLRMIESHDQKIEKTEFKKGDLVLLSSKLTTAPYLQNRPSASLQHKWSGPYEVIEAVGKNAYRLKLPDTLRIHPVISASYLQHYNKPTEFQRQHLTEPPPVEVDGHLEYVVESIISHRTRRKKREFLVKWQGFSTDKQTWEPEPYLRNAKSMLDRYKKEHGLK